MAVTKLAQRLIEIGAPGYMIAARVPMSPSRLSEYRLGKRKIPPHHLVALCRILQCNPDDIVGNADETVNERFVAVDTE